MLKDSRVHATLHAADLSRAKAYYADKLGLTPAQELPFALIYDCAERTRSLSPRRAARFPATTRR